MGLEASLVVVPVGGPCDCVAAPPLLKPPINGGGSSAKIFFSLIEHATLKSYLKTMTAPSDWPFPLNICDGILSTSNERESSGIAAHAMMSSKIPEEPCWTLLTFSVLWCNTRETPLLSMTKISPIKARAILT